MHKMLIQLDVEKIAREDKYDVEKMWDVIDKIFAERDCIKEINDDGSVMYSGNPTRQDLFADFSIAYVLLEQKQWFIENALKWIWYAKEGEEDEPFDESDTLKHVRKKHGIL